MITYVLWNVLETPSSESPDFDALAGDTIMKRTTAKGPGYRSVTSPALSMRSERRVFAGA